jgi:hypothetical protein
MITLMAVPQIIATFEPSILARFHHLTMVDWGSPVAVDEDQGEARDVLFHSSIAKTWGQPFSSSSSSQP